MDRPAREGTDAPVCRKRTVVSRGTRLRRSACGFTLIELLMVIVIIGILAALLLPAVGQLRKRALLEKAKAESRALKNAVKAYHMEYGYWPCGYDQVNDDKTYGDNNHEVLARLAVSSPDNPKGRLFVELDNYRRDGNGSVVDPWGRPYEFTFDRNEDTSIPAGVAVAHGDIP